MLLLNLLQSITFCNMQLINIMYWILKVMFYWCFMDAEFVTSNIPGGLYSVPNYWQSHDLMDTWMLTIKLVYKPSNSTS